MQAELPTGLRARGALAGSSAKKGSTRSRKELASNGATVASEFWDLWPTQLVALARRRVPR